MKTIKFITLSLILLLITSCVLESTNNKRPVSPTPKVSVSPKYKVENVRIEKDFSNAWGVKGMIRNVSSMNISGAVKVKFINSNGDIVYSTRAFVNDGDPIGPGQAGYFEYFASPEVFTDVTKFDVEFY